MGHRLVGESFELGADEIQSITGHLSSALIGDQLSIDTIEATVRPERAFHQGFIPSGSTGLVTSDSLTFQSVDTSIDAIRNAFIDGTPIQWYSGTNLKGKFFVDDLTRSGTNTWEISASSAIGLLRKRIHNGGIYIRQTVSDVLADIIGDTFTYTVSSGISSQLVAGWLPRASARDNLHQLILALGINITKDSSGDITFVFVEAGTPTSISNDRVFLGGKVGRGVPASRVEVTTHQYIALTTDETVILFDNTTGGSTLADHQLVVFSEAPVHDIAYTDGLTVHEYNENYAIVSGIGILTGQKYTHTTTILSKDYASANTENVKALTGDTLVNDLNGQNVLDRLYDYYTAADSVSTDIVVETELPNQLVQLEDAFGDARQLWIRSMDVHASTILRAACEMISGYTPSHNGNLYTHRTLITSSGTWTVPTGITLIRLILIAGGSGGQGGMDGADGYGGDERWGGYLKYVTEEDNKGYVFQNGNQNVPSGGAAGAAGAAGKVYAIDLDIASGTTLALTVGTAGTGGASGGTLGTAGTDSTATIDGTTISSASGQNAYAFVDLFTGNAYAVAGEAGHPGGDGGRTDLASLYAYTGNPGYDGGDVASNSGGFGGNGVDREIMGFDWLTNELYTQHKNLTANGITGTWNADNSAITLSGTATADYENQIIPNSDSELPYRPAVSGGGTLYVRGSGLSNSIKFKLTFLMSDSSTQDVYATSDSTDITIPANAQYVSYAGLVVVSGTALTSAVTVSVTLSTWLRRVRASGGGGGGSAYGADGTDGTAGTWNASSGALVGGSGGNGANASAPTTPAYGCGGSGGNGGGGGGNGAGCRMDDPASGWDVSPGNGGTGGTGSRGGHGGAGCVLIYY